MRALGGTGVALLVVAQALAGAAGAQTMPPATGAAPTPMEMTAPTEPVRRASLTISPVHLALPIVELMGEFQVMPHFGAAVIGAAGRISNDGVSGTAIEVGGQLNYYFMRRFAGLHAGAEVLYLSLSDIEQDSSVSGEGLSVGPFGGYKVMTDAGFTFVAQLGVAYLAVRADSDNATSSTKKFYPLVNLNIGWSF